MQPLIIIYFRLFCTIFILENIIFRCLFILSFVYTLVIICLHFLTNKGNVIICDKEWHAPKYIITGLWIIGTIIVYSVVIIGSIGFADTGYGYSWKTHCGPMNESAYTDSYNCQDLGNFSSFVWMSEIKYSIKL